MEEVFPAESADFISAVEAGQVSLKKNDIEAADVYFRLALIKAEILDQLYIDELKRREEAARLLLEARIKADAELELQKQLAEQAKAEEQARELQRLRAVEANRRKNEKQKQEREQQLSLKHTVKRGETLPQIASQADVYGDASLWPLLYRANRDQISDPSVLWPGQVLRIPRNNDRSDLNEARRFAAERPLR
jgi:nucleoid-associated protein YgaU